MMRLDLTGAEALHIAYTVRLTDAWPAPDRDQQYPDAGGAQFVIKFLDLLRDYYTLEPPQEPTFFARAVSFEATLSELWLIHSTFDLRELATVKLPDGNPVAGLAVKVWDALLAERVLIGDGDARDDDDHTYQRAHARDGNEAVPEP